MSILLDALRKSEKDQQKPEAPTIHSGELHEPVSGSLKRGLLASLIIVVLVASGWLVWHKFLKPDEAYQPPVTLPTPENPVPGEPVTPPPTGGSKNTSVASGKTAKGNKDKQRTPVESYQKEVVHEPDSNAGSGARPKTQSNGKVKTSSNAKAVSSKAAGEQKQQTAGKKTSVNSKTAKAASAKPNSGKPVGGKKEFQPEKPAPISYWELPDAIRADVPEIKFSVLVYAKKPTDRFVLIEGERYGHWDKLPSGVILKEIKREGVVFKFRLYEFLVER